MSQTRRLAAILAADVAGYSRLMGVDEEGTLAELKAIRRELVDPKIAEHHGRIVKTTGDGLLVEFQNVVHAVRCAVEVQRGKAEGNRDVPAEPHLGHLISSLSPRSSASLLALALSVLRKGSAPIKPPVITTRAQRRDPDEGLSRFRIGFDADAHYGSGSIVADGRFLTRGSGGNRCECLSTWSDHRPSDGQRDCEERQYRQPAHVKVPPFWFDTGVRTSQTGSGG